MEWLEFSETAIETHWSEWIHHSLGEFPGRGLLLKIGKG